jgi:hypothetical protein
MALVAEMAVLQGQVEELRGQLETLRIGEAHRGQIKNISLVEGIKECMRKGKERHWPR